MLPSSKPSAVAVWREPSLTWSNGARVWRYQKCYLGNRDTTDGERRHR